MTMSFASTKEENDLIDKIVNRAHQELAVPEDQLSELMMDLTAVNANGNPLDFEALLTLPLFEFAHDVQGISQYIDRSTGKLTQFFSPRTTKRA